MFARIPVTYMMIRPFQVSILLLYECLPVYGAIARLALNTYSDVALSLTGQVVLFREWPRSTLRQALVEQVAYFGFIPLPDYL